MEILVKFSGCIVRLLALKFHLSQSEICIPKYAFGKKKKKIWMLRWVMLEWMLMSAFEPLGKFYWFVLLLTRKTAVAWACGVYSYGVAFKSVTGIVFEAYE